MPIRGSPNGAAHSCPRFSTAWQLVDAIARNRWTPSLGMAVDAINRYGWTSSIGIGGRHHSVRPGRKPDLVCPTSALEGIGNRSEFKCTAL